MTTAPRTTIFNMHVQGKDVQLSGIAAIADGWVLR